LLIVTTGVTDQAEPYGLPFRWPKAAGVADAFRARGFADVSVDEVRRPVTFEGGVLRQSLWTARFGRKWCRTS
jgi:hypothetical protein